MGLDMYLLAERMLNKNTKRERKMIEYIKSLNIPDTDYYYEEEGDPNKSSLYLSAYNEKQLPIRRKLNEFKLYGQVGEIEQIIRVQDKKGQYRYGVKSEVMYWRKSNQIHKWFVDNVQNGVDDCEYYPVTLDKIYLFADTAKHVNKHNAADVMPTASGFFFGGTEYDEYYFNDVKETKKRFNKLKHRKSFWNHWTLYYHASW